MPASPSKSPHAPANLQQHDPWVHTVEHDVPLLHPKARSDAGDDVEEPDTIEGDIDEPVMPVNTDQPPLTPPKNVSQLPKNDSVETDDAQLPGPPRTSVQASPPSKSAPTTPSKSQGNNTSPNRDRHPGAGSIGSLSGGYVANLASQQSSFPSTTATATGTPGGGAAPSQRHPRPSTSFRSSPLAASTSSSSGMVAKNSHYFPTSASTSTTGLISTSSPSPGSPPFSHSPSTLTSTSSPPTLSTTSQPVSSPNSMPPSSSSSFAHQGPGQGARTGQRQRTFSGANSALSGSSSSTSPPMPSNVPYPNSHAYPHPNPANFIPPQQQQHQQQQQPFARQGSRNGPPPSGYPNSPNYGHGHRGPSEESRSGFEGGQSTPHAYSHTGFIGNGGGNGAGAGPGIGLRDPGIPHSHSRGSMILYRLSVTEDGTVLPPPGMPANRRASMYSNSGDSIASLGGESKYPLVGGLPGYAGSGTRTPGRPGTPGTPGTPASGSIGNRGGEHSLAEIGRVQGGLVAYVYDPGEDLDADELDEEEEEWVRNVGGHVWFASVNGNGKGDVKSVGSTGKGSIAKVRSQRSTLNKIPPMPNGKGSRVPTTIAGRPTKGSGVSLRGLMNVGTLVILLIGLLLLFLLYPIFSAYNNNGVEQLILANTRINSTGQATLELIGAADADNGDKGKREWTWNGLDRDFP